MGKGMTLSLQYWNGEETELISQARPAYEKFERGSEEPCTSGMYPLMNFMAPIRLQNVKYKTARMWSAMRGMIKLCGRLLAEI